MSEKNPALRFETGLDFRPLPRGVLQEFERWREAGRLGFMDLPGDGGLLEASLELAELLSPEIDTVVIDGIGGSALGPRALLSACGTKGRRVFIADSPDPRTIEAVKRESDPRRTLLAVVTKSGATAETMAVLLDFYDWLPPDIRDSRTVAVTDPVKGDLRKAASDRGWHALPIPPSVGGRYSVLSPVGVFPAALAGLDCRELLRGAAAVSEDFLANGPSSLASRIAACYLEFFRSHPVHVFFAYADCLYDTALWFAQLWAESLGKRLDISGREIRTGQTPLPSRGPADQHSLVQLFMEGPPDKFFTFLSCEDGSDALPGGFEGYPSIEWLQGRTMEELRSAEARATAAALSERGLPVTALSREGTPCEAFCGEVFMALEIATVLCGLALGVDPLDQPGVERGKILTFKGMGRPGYR